MSKMFAGRLRTIGAGFAFVLLLAHDSVATAPSALDTKLGQITFEQKLGQKVSLDLPFTDEEGKAVSLGSYFHGKPVIIVPGYYGCPMLCRAMANGLVNTLRDLPLALGKDFEVVNFSIDPNETPALAAQKKRAYLKSYARDTNGKGWHFLTGPEKSDRQLADEIGFHYYYDPESKQFAHASGFAVLTSDGKISHYHFGVDFSAPALQKSLSDAAGERIGSPLQRFLLLCFHYRPITGKYGSAAMMTLRLAAVALLAALGIWIAAALRAEKTGASKPSA